MTASEEIQAAIEKLTALRGSGPAWTLEGGREWISPLGIDVAPDNGGVSPEQAELMVTLHSTIDAQLAIMRNERDYVLTLARAINGATK